MLFLRALIQKNFIMNPIVKSNGIKYGVIFALVAIVYSFAVYVIDESFFTNWWISIVLMLGGVALFVVASVKAKSEMGGFITFREAFSAFMIAAIVYILASTLANMLLFHVIDPELGGRIQEMIIELMYERFEKFGMGEEQIAEAIQKMEEQDSFSMKGQLKGIFTGILFFAVIGLISSLIIKKNKPEWETIDNTENKD